MDCAHPIEGERAALGPMRRDLAATYVAWMNRVDVKSGLRNLGIYNRETEVMPWNAGAIRAYEKAGFRLIGRRRGALVVHGRRWDEIYMDAVPGEFTGSVLAGHLPSDTPPTA
jgi:RimJ/RimL family protein N-acetyltransferase